MEKFFKKHKKEFHEIRDRLVEFSKKIELPVGEFKSLVKRIQKGERESRIAKKRNGRGKSEVGNFYRKKIYKPWTSVLRPDSRR